MRLDVDYELNYHDGPIEFFGALDDEPIYAVLVADYLQDEPRVFHYWLLRKHWMTLARVLNLPADGTFLSTEVEPQI